jgi:hypothetical protein
VRWVGISCQFLIAVTLLAVGLSGLSGERDRSNLLSISQATLVQLPRPTLDVLDVTLAKHAWTHTALASSRDVLTAAAWVAAYRAALLRRAGPLERSQVGDTVADERLTALIADGPSHPLAWYLIANQNLAAAGFSTAVIDALKLSYVTGRFDLVAAERRVGLLMRYWPFLKNDFGNELKSDVRVMVFGEGYTWVNSRLAHIAYHEAPAQNAVLRQTLGEIKPDYLYWFDYETNLLRKAKTDVKTK